ncbi:SPOR domain-containing protein [Sphingomonas sp. BT-65]|uniref:SPOR domain-containing protein n=1 Tax=Sphingomonas sp. BT-65 TaxID=2989821 RepID=UPI00223552BA|nr:SPOR domain-containing protein [Sphingomonas sp. BT-65]MCW4463072.1 SPOR domain-containing protein [Sphingomonas sp. BT-65]
MNSNFRPRLGAAMLALAVSVALPAAAQEVVQPATPNADRLAEEMRTLARDPRNLRALVSAGEFSARLNDPAAAASFFARAQAIDPTNPRVLAGQAMVMVRMERPGEALRLFGEAERRGLSMEDYASDRGLAYDLIGAQPQALREHRVALRRNPDDETRRRLALSLGIGGNAGEAMVVLDPLLRRSDRAAWRARAFILAMNGDAAGADKIAASMMGGVGTALAPFFRRLPTLNAADKAFAVHFGELRKTPARIADAQLAPPLPRVAGETGVALASAELPRRVVPAPVETRRGPTLTNQAGRSAVERRREREQREELARRAAAETEARRVAEARTAQERETQRLAELKTQQEREALAARQREAEQQAARDAEARRVAEALARERAAAEQAARDVEAQRLAAASQPSATEPPAAAPAGIAPVETQVTQAAATPLPAPGFGTTSTSESPPAQAAQATPPAPRIGGEDNVIARIIAGVTIPASELGVEPMPNRRPPEPAPVAQPPAAASPPVEIARAEPSKLRPEPAKPKPETAKPEAAKAGARGKAVDPKAADPKAKAAATKTAAKAKPDPAKTEPARQWVQVAGGANVRDLPKAWQGLVAKAPAELKGRQAWTTPLRFTNRLLVGPFKTPGEAQTFVNAIGKKGISAFAWTSEAGQKIEKLSVK